MIVSVLQSLFERDLKRLKKEIELYKKEQHLWYVEEGISNSAGNLCLHLIGNLNAFIGAELGNSGYVRDRDLEFSAKNVSRDELLANIDATAEVVKNTLANLSETQLAVAYPVVVFKEEMTTGWFLVHLATHLNYHLGQINYHRRLLDKQEQ